MAIGIAVMAAGCGSNATPTTPTNGGGGGGGTTAPPPANNPPVVDSITIRGTRSSEPANFADLGEVVQVSAKVHDDETPVDQLQFIWTADVGTFTGTGPSVTWTAPPQGATPADVTLNLKVVEKFGYPGGPLIYENDTTGSAALSLHDSKKEVGDMAKQFLVDFSQSNITDVSYIMRNFQPGCYGTAEETLEVADNRKKFRIIQWTVGDAVVTVNFASRSPFRARAGDAFAAVPVYWKSIDLSDNSFAPPVAGTDWVAAFYYPDQRQWRLCDSQFDGYVAPSMRAFIR